MIKKINDVLYFRLCFTEDLPVAVQSEYMQIQLVDLLHYKLILII